MYTCKFTIAAMNMKESMEGYRAERGMEQGGIEQKGYGY